MLLSCLVTYMNKNILRFNNIPSMRQKQYKQQKPIILKCDVSLPKPSIHMKHTLLFFTINGGVNRAAIALLLCLQTCLYIYIQSPNPFTTGIAKKIQEVQEIAFF